MISSLLFLIVVLLLASSASESSSLAWAPAPPWAFVQGMAVYFFVLLLILAQNAIGKIRGRSASRLLILANCELVGALALFQFFFGGHRLLAAIPVIGKSMTLLTLFFLALYFAGVALFHATSPARSGVRIDHGSEQVRLLVPFTLPFLFFCVLSDITDRLPPLTWLQPQDLISQMIIMAAFTLLFLLTVFCFLPPMMVYIWRCRPLPDGEIKDRLEQLCERAHFRHGGILTWPLMKNSLTAAIVGVFPPLRYIMFTQRLLDQLPLTSVEAVLAHEMGHSRHKHLLLYPYVIFGAVVSIALFHQFVTPYVYAYLELKQHHDPFGPWRDMEPMAIFVPDAVIMLIYLRFAFGYFSRLFERQADLYPLELGLPADSLITALDQVAVYSGNVHRQPSWHHYSIQQRIDFLEAANRDPRVILSHHSRVQGALIIYTVLLVIGLTVLLSSAAP